MKNTRLVSLLLVGCVLVACGGSATPATEVPAPTEPTAAQQAPVGEESADQEPTEAVQAPSEAVAADVWSAESYSDSLHLFDSYTVKFTSSVTTNGQKQDWVYTQSVQMEPEIIFATWEGTASAGMGTMAMITTEDKLFLLSGNPQTCMVLSSPDDNPSIFNPETIMDSFAYDLVAAGAGPDVAGRATDKYVYDNTLADGAKYYSEVLVDREEQYTLTWDVSGENKFTDKLEPFLWSYRLTEINAVPPLAIPAACLSLTDTTWPMPSDAQVTLQTADMFSLTSAQSVADVAKFYAEAMPAAGYIGADGGTQNTDLVSQVYTTDGKTVTVMLTASDGTTTVIITQN